MERAPCHEVPVPVAESGGRHGTSVRPPCQDEAAVEADQQRRCEKMAFIYCVPPREVLFELTTVVEEEELEEESGGGEDEDARVKEASARGRRPSSVRVQLHVADVTRLCGDGAEKLSGGSATMIHPLTEAAEAFIKLAEGRCISSVAVDERREDVEGSSESGCCKCVVADSEHKTAVEQAAVACVAYTMPTRSRVCRFTDLVSSVRQRFRKAGINDVLLVTVLVLILVTVSLLTSIFERHEGEITAHSPGPDTVDALDDTWFMSREVWQAGERSPYLPSVNTTVDLVVVTQTVTNTCTTLASCRALVKKIQNMQVALQGFQDISYNFLVGGDGRIYEGRGWSAYAPICNYRCISVAFIGDYSSDSYNMKVMPDQLKYFKKLLDQGVTEEWLSPGYYIIPLCLIENTQSPGDNILSVLDQLPHFSETPLKFVNNSCEWPGKRNTAKPSGHDIPRGSNNNPHLGIPRPLDS